MCDKTFKTQGLTPCVLKVQEDLGMTLESREKERLSLLIVVLNKVKPKHCRQHW